MTQDQENITSMFETTLAYLDDKNALWIGKAALADAITEAKNRVTGIRALAADQEAPTGGITAGKTDLREDLEEKAHVLADLLAAFAAKMGNADLAAKAQMSRSFLSQAQDDDLVQTAERIRDAADTNVAGLAPYGVTAADVTALTAAIDAFSAMKTAPRKAAADRKGLTQTMPERIRNTRDIFRNQIDKMMTAFKKPNPEFYGGYFAARIIVNRAATQATPPPAPPPAPPATPPPAPGP